MTNLFGNKKYCVTVKQIYIKLRTCTRLMSTEKQTDIA